MQSESWKTVKETLLEALSLDPLARHKYLTEANLSAEVRAEVESLLTQESSAKDFMSVTASGFTREFFDGNGVAENSLIGQKIGIYEIASELGLGGMGAVYLAMRRDGKFEQKVAIKMLKRELNTEKIRRNFNREKQILAALSHPNIAKLIDAGTTEDAIPYLVMEYVEGEPIDQFCQSHKLSLNSRLKLFNRICETVAFAHRSLIVHRDLKPSNILITKEGEPKLLDFGIAKLLDAEAEAAGVITQLGAMTPLYASPEQIKGLPVTTATDVYSLGVVLFKVLTGMLPYKPGKRANGNLLREITETPPTLPSEAVRKSKQTAEPILQGNSRVELINADKDSRISQSELKGDLDNIVLKALRKDVEGRYQTVDQLSADIWRFVDGMPVLARPATLFYRASKFYGRNKVSVLAAAAILLSLFFGIAVAVSQARAAREQARIAGEQRDAAQRAGERAEKTSRFMQSFLDNANPEWYGRGQGRKDVTVREAIDDAAARIDTELADQPEVRGDLHYSFGLVYATHDEAEKSLQHMRKSLELYRQALGQQHPKVARGMYYLALGMKRAGFDLEEIKTLLRAGIAIMRQTDPDNVNLPYMLQQLAMWTIATEKEGRNKDRLMEAEAQILEAKTLFIRRYGENHGSTFTADSNLATLAQARGDLELAKTLGEEYVGNIRRVDEGGHSNIWGLFNLGEVYRLLGDGREAEKLFGEALEMGRRKYGADSIRFTQLDKAVSQARRASRKR
jgi:serine/threonine protein kinase